MGSTINFSHSSGNATVAGKGSFCGGLLGLNTSGGIILNSYSQANITTAKDTGAMGGLTGLNIRSTVLNSYATGDVTGGYAVGGLIGRNESSTLKNCYATGNVITFGAYGKAGGIAGENTSPVIENCYSTGKASGTKGNAFCGGIIGINESIGTIINSFWDTTKSGTIKGAGSNTQTNPDKYSVIGLDSTEMNNKNNFINAGWSETDWWLENGQPPKLAWEKTPPTPPDPPDPPDPAGPADTTRTNTGCGFNQAANRH